MTMAPTPEGCRHRFEYDPDRGEIVCSRGCGWAVPIFESRALAYAPVGRKLSSPSVAGGDGTDQDRVIYELSHNRDPGVNDFEGKKTVRQISGALRFLRNGRQTDSDEGLVVELSDRLHGRVSDSDLAVIAALLRKGLAQLEKERRRKARQLLDQMTGNGHG